MADIVKTNLRQKEYFYYFWEPNLRNNVKNEKYNPVYPA